MSAKPTALPDEARTKLKEGNDRYLEDHPSHHGRFGKERRSTLADGQSPFAAILTCADSRVDPEQIFDAELGELFVCRNAGNLVDEVTVGSIEYAVAHTGCPLVCVIGHDKCGAVQAAVKAAQNTEYHETHNVDDIIRRILPAVIATREEFENDVAQWVDAAAKQNVINMCKQILHCSEFLRGKVETGEIALVGMWYTLSSGRVTSIYE